MPISPEQAEELRQARQPVRGWIDKGGGWLEAPSKDPHLTQDYSDFAEIQRSRHDLVHHIETTMKVGRTRSGKKLPRLDTLP